MQRRTFVLAAAGAGLAAFAGCVGDGDGNDGGDADGSVGSGTGDGPGDEATDDGGDGGSGGDGTDGNGGDGSTDADGSDGTDDLGEPGGTEGAAFARTYAWEPSYAVDVTASDPQVGTVEMTIRYDGSNNYHQTMRSPEGAVESYHVDGTLYTVVQGQCVSAPVPVEVPDTGVDYESEDGVATGWEDAVASRTETVDGERMYVFEDVDREVTMYVSRATGYPRLVEFSQGLVEFHSWGQVGTIVPPAGC